MVPNVRQLICHASKQKRYELVVIGVSKDEREGRRRRRGRGGGGGGGGDESIG